jgi:thiamine transport system ATP-binding protein
MAEVGLAGVTTSFGAATALDGIDLRVREGEFFTLVGPSGCGKTTTLRTIAGLETPDAGTVAIGGESVAGVPPEDRDLGIVFQNYALFPHMSVRENVAYGLRFREAPGGQSTDERVRELLDLVDLAGFGDRSPEELSGGQEQRVALARALAPGPRLLLLDEPMSALDARLRERLRRQVRRIQSELGVTTVYVTHDQEEALAISDRLAVMRAGGIEQIGTPREVYRAPQTRFVASFVGENNLFDGEVAGRAGETLRVAVRDAEFRIRVPADGEEAGAGRRSQRRTVGDDVTVCVRPEALTPLSADTGDGEREADGEAEEGGASRRGSSGGAARADNRFPVEVTTREFLGAAVRIYGDWNGQEVVLRVPDVPERGSGTESETGNEGGTVRDSENERETEKKSERGTERLLVGFDPGAATLL